MPTRREFLSASAVFGVTALTGFRVAPSLASGRKLRYLVATPMRYWGHDQSFDAFRFDTTLKIPLGEAARKNFRTMLTVVGADGSGPRRVSVPGDYHSVTANGARGLIYLNGWHDSPMLALDAATLEVAAVAQPQAGNSFSGHSVVLPGSGELAVGLVRGTKGRYDAVSIVDARTLKPRREISTYGFSMHELRLAPDRKHLLCAHYGSYSGEGPYHDLQAIGFDGLSSPPPSLVYPAIVSLVDIGTGARFRRYSDVDPGPEGHADCDADYNVYLGNERPRLTAREGLEADPRFRENEPPKPGDDELRMRKLSTLGPCLLVDEKHGEVLVLVHRGSLQLKITSLRSNETRTIELAKQLNWKLPAEETYHLNGMAFHPDGKHYVLSSQCGLIAVARGSHKINHGMSVQLPLMMHAHLSIL